MFENKKQHAGKAASTAAKDRRTPLPDRVSSRALLGEARELIIEHNDREYHLRVTQQGNLILTA